MGAIETKACQKLFEKNMEFFRKFQPSLHERLDQHSPLSELLFEDDGEPDLKFEGSRMYGCGAAQYAQKQVEKFWQNPSRPQINPISSDNVSDLAKVQLYEMLEAAEQDGVKFSRSKRNDEAFHLFILGVGLGYHIKPMLDRVKPRNILIVEPNIEFLYQSMFTFDWAETVGDLIKDDCAVHFIVEQSKDVVIHEMRTIFRVNGPASFDGMTVYVHYENSMLKALVKYMQDHGDMLISGLGFFEDELNIIANSYLNLKTGKERVFFAETSPKPFPIFVIGSGPSLDMAMDVIRENQHKAIIISCGTALPSVVRGGVKPDFHIELERSRHQVSMPQTVSDVFDFSKVWLVASTTILRETAEMFPNHILFFRHMLSCFPAFSGNLRNCLRNPSPTVGNSGVSFAQDMGFREIYFFGLDMGFKHESQHHAVQSPYKEVLGTFDYGWDKEVPGNFGGILKTTSIFRWSRENIEQSMVTSAQGFKYFNCSDGAVVKGAVPLLPEFVDLPEPKMPKAEFVEKMVEGFPVYSKEIFDQHWQDGKLIQDIHNFGEALVACVEREPDLSTKKYLSHIAKVCKPEGFDNPAAMVIRGSLYHMLISCEYYLDRVVDEEKRPGFVDVARESLIKGIRSLCEVSDHEFTHLMEHGSLDQYHTS